MRPEISRTSREGKGKTLSALSAGVNRIVRLFKTEQAFARNLTFADVIVLVGLTVVIYIGVRLALNAPAEVKGPSISLSKHVLPWYASFSVARMLGAYTLSVLFSLIYGRLAAYNRRAEQILLPLLDVLQSVPILSFLPVVLLGLAAVLPTRIAAEVASVVLIFTSQVWNLTFAWYQSLTTIPKELQEASSVFQLNGWMRLKYLELPFAALSLLWNSMMSWAGGWFFLMAAEIFTVGKRDFRLPGLGAYLQEAANKGDVEAIIWGLSTLVLVIVALDQLVWRPLLAWADRFKLEMVESENPPTSWFYNLLCGSSFTKWVSRALWKPLGEWMDAELARLSPPGGMLETGRDSPSRSLYLIAAVGGIALAYGAYRAGAMLINVPLLQWGQIALGALATLLRVAVALSIALAWTIPVGVAIGSNPRLAAKVQPVVQVAASVPATALFPVFLLALVHLPAGLNLAAILLMLTGTQWYLLFNVIAGASAIPQDLKYTASLMRLSGWGYWRILNLPALFPYVITGAITASGGAWNASIVAEHVSFGGRTLYTTGIGALIARATATGDYPLLLASTLSMILAVVLINRLLWRRLYRVAEARYRME
ncbi:MAG: ABC transporter permease [Armatimonadota bacterium]